MTSLTESWCQDDSRTNSMYKLENYNCVHQFRKGKRGGRICVFVHDSLDIQDRSDLFINSEHIEALCFEIKNDKTKNIIVNTVYRPPTGKCDEFLNYLTKFFNTGKIGKKKHIYSRRYEY